LERFFNLYLDPKINNVALRALAQKQGLSLSEQCITTADGKEMLFAMKKEFIKPRIRFHTA
jgi:uncharacterized protein YneF (UPF0154 family)